METKLRLFSLYMSYLSFFYKILVALVYWKDSLDFDLVFGVGQQRSPKNKQFEVY